LALGQADCTFVTFLVGLSMENMLKFFFDREFLKICTAVSLGAVYKMLILQPVQKGFFPFCKGEKPRCLAGA
jgi:hypothetical protein